jgi:hypothetical protein
MADKGARQADPFEDEDDDEYEDDYEGFRRSGGSCS